MPIDDTDLSGHAMLRGRFQLHRRLGAGAFGAVYSATEYALGQPLRQVAVKLTHQARLGQTSAVEMLQDGFRLAKVLAGCRVAEARKHLIHVYEIGVADDLDGRGYTIMEFVSGKPLLGQMNAFGGPIPVAMARRYFREMCLAVGACHLLEPPMIHGDLKPDNVLVDTNQTIRVIDFGLARQVGASGYVADQGGCLPYTAPEVLLGKAVPASDIYSLGLILYEALTGGGPHQDIPKPVGKREQSSYYFEQKRKLVFRPVAELSRAANPDPVLFAIVDRCVRFDVSERHASLRDLVAELDGRSAPAPAQPSGSPRVSTPTAVKTAPPAPPLTPLEIAMRKIDARDHAGAMTVLEPLGRADPGYRAGVALIAAARSQWREVIEQGGQVFEREGRLGKLPPAASKKLAAALRDACRALCRQGEEFDDLAEHYSQVVGRMG